jgi:hypothetical protein
MDRTEEDIQQEIARRKAKLDAFLDKVFGDVGLLPNSFRKWNGNFVFCNYETIQSVVRYGLQDRFEKPLELTMGLLALHKQLARASELHLIANVGQRFDVSINGKLRKWLLFQVERWFEEWRNKGADELEHYEEYLSEYRNETQSGYVNKTGYIGGLLHDAEKAFNKCQPDEYPCTIVYGKKTFGESRYERYVFYYDWLVCLGLLEDDYSNNRRDKYDKIKDIVRTYNKNFPKWSIGGDN